MFATRLTAFLIVAVVGNSAAAGISPAAAQLATAAPMELIILHNNDMHARFEQTDALSKMCNKEDALLSKCYGGFARVAYKWVQRGRG